MLKPGSRDVVLLLSSMGLASVPVGYLQVVLPLYLNRAGIEPSVIGLLYSLSGLVTAGLVAFSGTLADRFGRRGFLIWGTALPICSYLIFAATTDPRWLVLASVIGGVGLANGAAGALTIASFDAMLAGHTPPLRRTRVFAGAQALWSMALGLGALCAGLPELLRQARPELGNLEVYRAPFIAVIVPRGGRSEAIRLGRESEEQNLGRIARRWCTVKPRTRRAKELGLH